MEPAGKCVRMVALEYVLRIDFKFQKNIANFEEKQLCT